MTKFVIEFYPRACSQCLFLRQKFTWDVSWVHPAIPCILSFFRGSRARESNRGSHQGNAHQPLKSSRRRCSATLRSTVNWRAVATIRWAMWRAPTLGFFTHFWSGQREKPQPCKSQSSHTTLCLGQVTQPLVFSQPFHLHICMWFCSLCH